MNLTVLVMVMVQIDLLYMTFLLQRIDSVLTLFQAVEIFPDSNVYCSQTQYERAEMASSATMYARRVIEGVFTLDALQKCSVSGLPPRGKGRDSYKNAGSVKPYLDPKGVNAIVCKSIFILLFVFKYCYLL